jgi:hypothetical protein
MARGNDERNNKNRKVDRSRLTFIMPTHGLVLNQTQDDEKPVDITDSEAMGRIAEEQQPYLDELTEYLGGDPADIAASVSEEDEYKYK